MKKLTSAQVRQMYLDFFAEKNHQIIPSASLIPVNDPTLLWINAGVAPLKKYFDGTEIPENPRLANSQKCIRTNDIENVGYTARHHTLFEMLGNWSIGEYFKTEAIAWAWEFLTDEKWLAFDPELLYMTYYPEDTETPEIWKKQPGFIADHLVPIADNFWDIGAGPCGPDTEIFYDRGEAYSNLAADDPENYPGGENERWLEIWNLVFSEFNHLPDDTYKPLPNKNVDTGMGLERVVSVIQDAKTNYETDLFIPIIRKIEAVSGVNFDAAGEKQVSFKVIADHTRAVSFAIADGALPSNEGRGYILRRLIRRSVMHGRKLGIEKAFLSELVPVIADIMGEFYSELVENMAFVQKVLKNEEERFHETIEGGEKHLENIMAELKATGKTEIAGSQAFQLYDTFGFPLELTVELAEDNGFTVDTAGFDSEMAAQRERARAARSKEESMKVQSDLLQNILDEFTFLGYETIAADATITTIVANDEKVNALPAHSEGWLFFNHSPFYAEMGGQVADKGTVLIDNVLVGEVLDVKKAPQGQYMHLVRTFDTELSVGYNCQLRVDRTSRNRTNHNHTATHLLHQALKEVLGTHANQAGSLVTPTHLRFDFSHFGQVTTEELEKMEQIVNQKIWEAIEVVTIETTIDKAKEMGAMALFGEKYGTNVRVVNVGDWSIELCGGTHVSNTSEIGLFKIVSESGIGAGVRRIEAVTGKEAYELLSKREQLLKQTAKAVKATHVEQVPERVENLQVELKEAHGEISSLKAKVMKQETADLFANVEEVNGTSYIAVALANKGMDELRQLADTWRAKEASDVFVVATHDHEKANLLVSVSQEGIQKGIKAGELIKAIAPHINGGGGGRPDMAQAGGKNPAGIPQALQAVKEFLEK